MNEELYVVFDIDSNEFVEQKNREKTYTKEELEEFFDSVVKDDIERAFECAIENEEFVKEIEELKIEKGLEYYYKILNIVCRTVDSFMFASQKREIAESFNYHIWKLEEYNGDKR